jgi:hypothetical protein
MCVLFRVQTGSTNSCLGFIIHPPPPFLIPCFPQAMIKIGFLVAVIAVVGSKAPTPFHSFNKAGKHTASNCILCAWCHAITCLITS